MTYLPFDQLDALQRDNRRAAIQDKARFKGILGNHEGTLYVPGFNGNRVYVRMQGASDENGILQYQQVTIARLTGANFLMYRDAPVLLRYDHNNNLVIDSSDYESVEQTGSLSMAVVNVANPQLNYVDLTDSLILLSRPTTTASNSTTTVYVAQWLYDYHGLYHEFAGTPLEADKVDLASYIPSAGNHRVVQLWVDTYTREIQVTASTTQALSSNIVKADYDECWADKYNDWIPIQSYYLADGQTSLNAQALDRDHRQWINVPSETGFPVNDTRNYRIWDNHAVTSSMPRFLDKTLIAYGTLVA
jgi:hypothetical protein